MKVEHGPASWAYYNEEMLAEGGPFAFYEDGLVADTVRNAMGKLGKVFGLQGTGGSTSTRDGFVKMREAGAAARLMLVAAAGVRLGVPSTELETSDGTILHKASGRSLTYGEVAADAASLEVPTDPALKDKSQWKLLGKSQKRVDMLAKVTGAPIFGIDVSLPDMLYGTVKLSPRFWVKPLRWIRPKLKKCRALSRSCRCRRIMAMGSA